MTPNLENQDLKLNHREWILSFALNFKRTSFLWSAACLGIKALYVWLLFTVFRLWCNLYMPLLSWRLFISLTIRKIWLVQCGHPRLWLVERGAIWLSNFITERELGSQKFLPDMNLALKNSYQTRIWLSNINTRHLTNRKRN